MRKRVLVLVFCLLAGKVQAALKSEAVLYKQNGVTCEGYLAYDDAAKGKRPGILVVHEWTGLGPYAKRRSDELAQMGYVAFAIDMYGKGVRAKDHNEAAQLSGIYRNDRKLMRERALAGLEILKKNPLVDPGKIAAIGYCFGGTTALEIARSGAGLLGVISFHGGLDTPNPQDAKNIKGKVLAFQGGDDSFTLPGVPKFEEEMKGGGVDWQLVTFGGAVHSFTVKEAGNDPSTGMAYNEAADRRSWQMMRIFFDEIFKKSP